MQQKRYTVEVRANGGWLITLETSNRAEALRAFAAALVDGDARLWGEAQPEPHKIRWWVYAGSERIPHEATMRGSWGWDATCSCGWDSRTGGGTKRYVQTLVDDHKLEARNGGAR